MAAAPIEGMLPCTTCGHPNPDWARFCGQCGARTHHEAVDPLVGQTLAERYRVLRPIGAGAMGTVYLAEQRLGHTSRRVAIKVLSDAVRRDADLIARFHRECAAMASLDHPNTVRLFDFGELTDGTPYMVMEHVDGEPLSLVLERGPMPLERVQRIVAQIAGSLQQAHERGIVHRDLKPDNVILLSDGPSGDVVKLLDFGIAKHIGETRIIHAELTAPGTVLGTPEYMAPEQFAGGTVDARTDVYALGLMVYEMLSGRRPFEAETPLEWATKHLHEAPRPLDLAIGGAPIRPEVREAVERALAKRLEDRPASVMELAEQLSFPSTVPAATRSGGGTRSRVDSLVVTPPPVKTSYRALLAIAVLVVLIGGGLTAWAVMGDGEGEAGEPLATGTTDPSVQDDDPAAVEDDVESDGLWLESLHHVRNASDAQNALGPTDGRHATIRPGGMLTLEVGDGTLLVPDGSTASDLTVHASEGSGPYSVHAGRSHHEMPALAVEARGITRLDLDALGVDSIRFVRVWNRARQGNVYLDAVGGIESVEQPAEGEAKP